MREVLKISLPVDEILGELTGVLGRSNAAVLVAPPGAGKTTRIPLVLAREPWAAGAKILVLEPRRIAARAAAERMALMLGEQLGTSIGLRARLQSRTGPANRVEVVTEGVFTRMIMDDPMLDGVAAVVFDEFHERSLDADQGLALALEAQATLREDLRILVMSATLDGARVARLLGGAPVVESEGRAFPVETRHAGREPNQRIEEAVCALAAKVLRAEQGSLLVFLPGQGEIRRCAALLQDRISDPLVDIAPLYGAMDRRAQDLAIEPAAPGRRKIVLATSIAETSITIEGVRVVIDSGLARVPRFEPGLGLTRLETVRVSRAGADQRRGRAGRTEPGVCYRLWEEAATQSLEPFARPEILAADLAPLLLDLAQWGTRDPAELAWLDPPPVAAVAEARKLLQSLGALDADGAITEAGKAMRALPLPPRLARMVIEAAKGGAAGYAADLAAVLVERGMGGDGVDLAHRVDRFRTDRSRRAQDMRRLAEGWAKQTERFAPAASAAAREVSCGAILALAYPDRIAKARGAAGAFLMANGRAAQLEAHEALARALWLVIAEISGRAASARILAAAAIAPEDVETAAIGQMDETEETIFDRASASVKRRKLRRYGAIALNEQPLPVAGPEAARVLAQGIAALGIERLPWSKAQLQMRERAGYLRRAGENMASSGEGDKGSREENASGQNDWPDLSDATLAASAADWLASYIEGKSGLAAITADDLGQALQALLPWPLPQRLETEAPTHFECPTGSRIALDYGAENGPLLSVRVQELYGLKDHPAIAGGRIPLTLELLSPAHRPIQITRDLPGFWKGSWGAVKSDMKGRYPKHFWPDDPAGAAPTTRVKARM
ncbi:MAG: ATP-dependent helicase HrpB [Beijerinckiaceae bacterium]